MSPPGGYPTVLRQPIRKPLWLARCAPSQTVRSRPCETPRAARRRQHHHHDSARAARARRSRVRRPGAQRRRARLAHPRRPRHQRTTSRRNRRARRDRRRRPRCRIHRGGQKRPDRSSYIRAWRAGRERDPGRPHCPAELSEKARRLRGLHPWACPFAAVQLSVCVNTTLRYP
jgi:hypothetical protein